ncbi:MAG TPA: TlpA disulfide reductase family protein [Bacteriovoracaceae bacterium]|nr:TlpA disulfide reductase family protein [Bacteriovoracaceae bacterium]
MKKHIPILLFIMAFSGFLSTQILWDTFHLNAENVEQDKQKHSVYETNFQSLVLTTTKKQIVDLRNQTSPIIILNFWASWCQPCLREFPSLVKFQDKYAAHVKVVGINGDEEDSAEKIKKIEDKYKLNFGSVEDSQSSIGNKFMINSYPVSIVFHKGKVIYVNKKIHDFMDSDFLAFIDSALKN